MEVSLVASAQKAAIKSNGCIGEPSLLPNVGMEFALGKRTTLELGGGFNLWNLKDGKRFKHWLVQPELRYWTCEAFNGHFFGLHAHGAQFNVGGWDILLLAAFKDTRYQGYLYGAGSTGLPLDTESGCWNFELSLGIVKVSITRNFRASTVAQSSQRGTILNGDESGSIACLSH